MKIDRKKLETNLANKCINISELSSKADVSMTTLQRVQSGYEVKPRTVGLIARALGVSVDAIIEDGKEGDDNASRYTGLGSGRANSTESS